MIFKPKSWGKRPTERRSRLVQRFPSARIFRAIPTCIFPALWYNRKAPVRVQRSCLGGMRLRVQCACFGSAAVVSGTGQGETPQSLVTPAFAGLSPISESRTKAALTSGMTTDRKFFDFPLRRGIMTEIEYPGVAQLVARLLWERVTPPALTGKCKSRNPLQTLAFWHFIPSARSPKITV